jgi:hypothetical protein
MDRAQESEIKNAAALILTAAVGKRKVVQARDARSPRPARSAKARSAKQQSSEPTATSFADVFRGIVAAVRKVSGRGAQDSKRRSPRATKAV